MFGLTISISFCLDENFLVFRPAAAGQKILRQKEIEMPQIKMTRRKSDQLSQQAFF